MKNIKQMFPRIGQGDSPIAIVVKGGIQVGIHMDDPEAFGVWDIFKVSDDEQVFLFDKAGNLLKQGEVYFDIESDNTMRIGIDWEEENDG